MTLTKKVQRLEYIARMGFDNTVDEKDHLMEYFSELERKYAALQSAAEGMAAALYSFRGSWDWDADDQAALNAYRKIVKP